MTEGDAKSRWQRVRALFEAAIEQPASERAAWLAQACADDASLRAEVETMLAADAAATSHTLRMDRQAALLAAAAAHAEDGTTRWIGQRVGAYRIERLVGRGGMGAVFLAERDDGEFRQQVAIKLIGAGFGAERLHERLRAERQILAGLAHPRIARLLDGGIAADGTPFIAMEYVEGVDIVHWAHAHRGDVRACLRLFLALCDAVAHAHQHLVVHRDIKPSNILVDGEGRPKLLDFGVAKLLDGDAGVSGLGSFTPAYAAPEQVRGETVTTAVDIYALGLVLYEMLTGVRPYRVDAESPRAYELAVLEQTPTRPSEALLAAPELDAAAIRRALRGDLDAIVLRALRKEPEQRYASVADLAADITRHLEHRPVLARQGNLRYVTARFLRRHALALSLLAVAVTSLIVGLAFALVSRDHARAEAARANAVTDFMVEVFERADPLSNDGKDVSAREVFERARARIDGAVHEPQARAELLLAMARALSGVSPSYRLTPLTEEALALRRQAGDPDALVEALGVHAMALIRDGRDDEVIEHCAEIDALAAVLKPEAARAARFDAHRWRATALMHSRRIDAAISEFEAALAAPPSGLAALDPLMVDIRNRYGFGLVQAQRFADAEQALGALAVALRAADPPRRGELSTVLNNLVWAYPRFDQLPAAEATMREALKLRSDLTGGDPRQLIGIWQNVAWLMKAQGHHQQAHDELAAALASVLAMADAELDETRLVPMRRQLAELLWLLGEPRRAADLVRPQLAVQAARLGETHVRTAAPRVTLAAALIDLGDFDAAAAELSRAAAVLTPQVQSQARPWLLTEQVRLALRRKAPAECREIDAEAISLRQQPAAHLGASDHYLLAYAALCRLMQAPTDAAARAELDASEAWLRKAMPASDSRVRGIAELRSWLPSRPQD